MHREMIKRALTVFAIFALLSLYAYAAYKGIFGVPCYFYELTHLYCPGCGASRMFLYIFQFKFARAFRMNPLLFAALPFLAVYLAVAMYYYIIEKQNPIDKKIPKWLPYLIVAVVIIYGILRNIPMLSFLAPTELG